MTYASTILPLYGGVYWGMAMANANSISNTEKVSLYAFGTLPALLCWTSLQFTSFEGR
jgi:hypothetical protein